MNKADLLSKLSTESLFQHHAELNGKQDATSNDRMVAAWLADEIERRIPEIVPALDRIFEDDTFTGTYAEALRLARAEVAA